MAAAADPEPSLRATQAESSRLVWAFSISLAIHLLLWGGFQTGQRLHLWEHWEWPNWMRPPRMLTELFHKKPTPQEIALMDKKQAEDRVSLLFIDVSPAQAAPEPPKKADYYSDKHSLAANPDTSRDTNIPKIDGKQTELLKTVDIVRPQPVPFQPAPPPPPPPAPLPVPVPKPVEAPKPEVKPRATPIAGDLTLGHPAETNRPAEGQADEPRPAEPAKAAKPEKPRTLTEARLRLQDKGGLVGEKMRQEGGVRRNKVVASVDAIGTAFGAYDSAIAYAIQYQWYKLLEDRLYADERKGKVVLRFRLSFDGSISQMTLVQNTVDLTLALLCESAIQDSAPFQAWPADMRRMNGADYREVTFTFYYR